MILRSVHAYPLQCAGIIPLASFMAWLMPCDVDFRPRFMLLPLLAGLASAIAVAYAGNGEAEFTLLKYPLPALAAILLALVVLMRNIGGMAGKIWRPAIRFVLLASFFILFAICKPAGVQVNAPANRILFRHYERLLRAYAEDGRADGKQLDNFFRITVTAGDSTSAVSVRLFAHSLTAMGFRSINGECCEPVLDSFDPETAEIPAGARFVILGSSPAAGARAERLLTEKGLRPRLIDHSREHDDEITLHMWIYGIREE